VTLRTGSPILSTGIVDPTFSSVQSAAVMAIGSSVLAAVAGAAVCAPCKVRATRASAAHPTIDHRRMARRCLRRIVVVTVVGA